MLTPSLIVHADVTDQPTDHGQIDPTLTALTEVVAVRDAAAAEVASDDVDDEAEKADEKRLNLLADAGYYSDDNVVACETAKVNAYIAKGRRRSRRVAERSALSGGRHDGGPHDQQSGAKRCMANARARSRQRSVASRTQWAFAIRPCADSSAFKPSGNWSAWRGI